MILDISGKNFQSIFDDKNFHLPIQWDGEINGSSYIQKLEELFDNYLKKVGQFSSLYIAPSNSQNEQIDPNIIKGICKSIISVVKAYLDGYPYNAYSNFNKLMNRLDRTPLKIYSKSIHEQFESNYYHDKLNLYRVTCVGKQEPANRKRVFHTPFYLRSKISTNRYSIAGYPCLYLGTSLELCCSEVNYTNSKMYMASRFQLDRAFERNRIEIKIIELAIKPQDFLEDRFELNDNRKILHHVLQAPKVRKAYLLWYPLIAACSFIRANKGDPFAVEYIIPQLLMQWVRKETRHARTKEDEQVKKLVGIRYFSCASVQASDMGFNYVFPTVFNDKNDYCSILSKAFRLTQPHYIHEYDNIERCEEALRDDMNLDFI